MDYKQQAVILLSQTAVGFLAARFLIPYFRKIKTGKFDFYIGDRFKQDGSEPKFGGAVIALTFILGIVIGFAVKSADYGDAYSPYNVKIVVGGTVLALMLMCLGLYQDYLKETKRGIGIKARYIIIGEFALCFGFLLLKAAFYDGSDGVLLPFRLGYMQMGKLYFPVMAAFMVLAINSVKLNDCMGGDTSKSVQGLGALTAFIYSLGLLGAGSIIGMKNESMLFAVCTAGALCGFIVWTLFPSKLYLGESGSLLLGGLIVVMTELSGLQFAFFLFGICYVIDGISALLQYLVYKSRKKLLLKGLTLHEHLKVKDLNDYKIMMLFAAASVIGAAAGVGFFVYSTHLLIK